MKISTENGVENDERKWKWRKLVRKKTKRGEWDWERKVYYQKRKVREKLIIK